MHVSSARLQRSTASEFTTPLMQIACLRTRLAFRIFSQPVCFEIMAATDICAHARYTRKAPWRSREERASCGVPSQTYKTSRTLIMSLLRPPKGASSRLSATKPRLLNWAGRLWQPTRSAGMRSGCQRDGITSQEPIPRLGEGSEG